MMYLPKNYFFGLPFCIILLLSAISLYGQDRLRFTGPLRLGEYHGNADFWYKIAEGDTILSGPFSMQSFSLNALLSDGDRFFSLDGYFVADVPDSIWRFRFGEFNAEAGTQLIDNHFKLQVSGVQHLALAPFRQGKPQGTWTHLVKKVDSSAIETTLFKSQLQFNEGLAQGNFRLEDETIRLLGRFLQDGFAHDIWELDFDEEPGKREEWYFLNGRLEKILIRNNQLTDTLRVYPDEMPHAKAVNLDASYFKILSMQQVYDSTAYAKMGGKMAHEIRRNGLYYQRVEHILKGIRRIAKPASRPQFKVKVAGLPLNEEESKQVAALEDYLQKIDTLTQPLLRNTRLNILKHADEHILFLLSAVKEISENYLSSVRRVVAYQQEGLLDYMPRKNLQPFSGVPPKTIEVSYPDSSGLKTLPFVGPQSAVSETNRNGFDYLLGLSEYALLFLKSIQEELVKELRDQKIQLELEGIEKDLLSHEERLIDLVDSLGRKLPKRYAPTLKTLITTTNRELRHYSTTDDLPSKSEQARKITKCLEGMEELALSLSKLPARWEEIQKLYTEEVWNPFTVTTMSDQIKERLTQAYDQLLIPSMLHRIRTELTCANTQLFREALDTLYQRMQEFRKKDTSKLERKLKNEDDPQVVMHLFEISM